MTLIESVRAWLKTYPPLTAGRLNVDFLPEKARTYSVDVTPCRETIKAYLDGSALKQFDFVLASRDYHSGDAAQNLDNLGFYESFARWVEEQNRRRALPVLDQGRCARWVEVTASGYPFLVDDHGTARYQVQLKMVYSQKGAR